MTTQTGTYRIEIRNSHGTVLAEGTGHTDWQQTATRLARAARLAGRTDSIAAHQYFPTDLGSPIGTHHCQWGHTLSKRLGGATTCGPRYVVSVQPATALAR